MELTIKNLNKSYANGVHALQDVSLEIPAGMFGLLGHNGAGKSTLMRILATLQEADSGEARLGSIDMFKDKLELKKYLGYLPQDFGFYPKDKPLYLLDHFAFLKGIKDKKERSRLVEMLLKRVNLWDSRKQKIGAFSGGMKQQFGIAVALLGNPKLIIVDEPTAGLDPEERNRFHNLLSELGEDLVIILSTHIVEDISDLCTRTAIISHGKILLTGNPLDEIAKLKGKIWQKSIDKHQLHHFEDKFNILSKRLYSGQTIVRALSDKKPAEGFAMIDANLEDVYFNCLKTG